MSIILYSKDPAFKPVKIDANVYMDINDHNLALRILNHIEHWGIRVPDAEPYIVKNPDCATVYAIKVIKGRWPEAEPYIMKSPEFAMNYMTYIIHGCWPEAEPYIMKDIKFAYEYVRMFKGRWPEAEEYLKQDPAKFGHYKKRYIRDISKNDNISTNNFSDLM